MKMSDENQFSLAFLSSQCVHQRTKVALVNTDDADVSEPDQESLNIGSKKEPRLTLENSKKRRGGVGR